MVCFSGRGPGEVFSGDKKVVGLSQRRTRDWIRFQTLVHRRFSAESTAALLSAAVESEVVARWQSQVYEIGGPADSRASARSAGETRLAAIPSRTGHATADRPARNFCI